MRKKRINKIFGIILAVALPITLIGAVSLMMMFPSQEFFRDRGWNRGMHNQWMLPWTDFDGWGHMNNGHMNNGHMNNGHMNGNNHMGNNSNSSTLRDGDSHRFDSIQSLQIRGMVDNVRVQATTSDQVELSYSGNETLRVSVLRNRLVITTSRSGMNLNSILEDAGELVILIPDGLRELDIDPGASNISIDGITIEHLDVDLGVGSLDITGITVSRDTDIDAGKGNITIKESEFKKLDVEGGIGNITINTIQAQVVELESGVGTITLNDSVIDFLRTEQGIGSIELNKNTIREHKKD